MNYVKFRYCLDISVQLSDDNENSPYNIDTTLLYHAVLVSPKIRFC